VATSNTNSGAFTNVALFAAEADWAASDPAGVLTTTNGGSKRVGLGGSYVVDSSGNPKKIYAAMPYGGARIETRGSAVATSGYTLDFAAQFAILRKCSDALAALPNGAVAEHATLLDPATGGPYPGIGQPTGDEVMLRFEDDANGDVATAVLNVSESQLAALDTVLRENGSSLSAARPLVVNVHDDDGDGNVTFDFDSTAWTNVGDAKRVIFNFPNAVGTVTIVREAYGAVFAPYGHVVTNDDVQGQIVARTWTHQDGIVKSGPEYEFTGAITWT
jgi:choice-of-anchor A domain-containing protein